MFNIVQRTEKLICTVTKCTETKSQTVEYRLYVTKKS